MMAALKVGALVPYIATTADAVVEIFLATAAFSFDPSDFTKEGRR